ncbi:hypothetical protein EDD90_2304 [Streptomyces sp. Ag109_O5-1]|nr:hypothetical protein EDD90_2304 [Streptomyces sp. Ag109_O5-1]
MNEFGEGCFGRRPVGITSNRLHPLGQKPEVLTSAQLTACFGRQIEVARHAARWTARSAPRR